MLFGLLLMAAGAAIALWQHEVTTAYAELGQQIVSDSAGGAARSPIGDRSCGVVDWSALAQQNQDIAAWVIVDGTSISLPVVEAKAGDGDYYLTHDFWGRLAFEGTPFLDHRSSANDMHRLVYGHHLTTGGQFSELQKAYGQEVFDQLGPCRWYTPDNAGKTMRPLCALRVDMHCGQIQRFVFPDVDELRHWLTELESLASATSVDAPLLAGEAISAVTLVTCSSDHAWKPWRTLVVFVETPADPSASTGANGGSG